MRVAIIPARGGSQRIPHKNIRLFHGKPIIRYSIETAQESGLFDKVIVSTDYGPIADEAVLTGATELWRPDVYAVDECGTQDVTRQAVKYVESFGIRVEHVCCVYATAPMMTADDLRIGLMTMLETDRYAYVHGWYYWGRAEWFGRLSLEEPELERPKGRWIDINTEGDWMRAEKMYAALHKEGA